ncbi:MAG: tryptophan-rich sensory protein [Myxococcota bacterium]|jgi:tryptophan-rich sensory protein
MVGRNHKRRSPGLGAQVGVFVLLLVLVTAAASSGALSVDNTQGEYMGLTQPSWAPPGWLFGPVWSVLYLMIAASAWLVWKRAGFGAAMALWCGQMVLNAAWTPIFFGFGQTGWALVDIVLLWFAIVGTIAVFWRISRPAAGLLLPYLAWVSFATALNAAIWSLN